MVSTCLAGCKGLLGSSTHACTSTDGEAGGGGTDRVPGGGRWGCQGAQNQLSAFTARLAVPCWDTAAQSSAGRKQHRELQSPSWPSHACLAACPWGHFSAQADGEGSASGNCLPLPTKWEEDDSPRASRPPLPRLSSFLQHHGAPQQQRVLALPAPQLPQQHPGSPITWQQVPKQPVDISHNSFFPYTEQHLP